MFSATLVSPERPNDLLNLECEFLAVRFPAREIGRQPFFNLRGLTAVPSSAKQIAIEVEGDKDRNLFRAFLHERLFLRERLSDFVVHPPTRQGISRAAEQYLVPEANAAVHFIMDVVAWTDLFLIKPASDIAALKRITEPPGKRLVSVVVTDKARIVRIVLNGPCTSDGHHAIRYIRDLAYA